MVTAVTTGSLFNPTFSGLSIGMSPSGSLSQYIEDGSLFSGMGMNINPGMGYGVAPMGGAGYFDMMVQRSDMGAALGFITRSNQHVLASYGEIMMKNMPELADALRRGEYGRAGKIYDELYRAISQNYGREIKNNQDRVNFDQSIKATLSQAYQQINGTTIAMDAAASKESYFENGFMQGLTIGNHHRNCSEEIEAYMTGTRIEGYGGKKAVKSIGRLFGSAINVGGFAAAGAAIGACFGGIGAVPGAIAGTIVGAVLNLGSWIFSGNQPSEVKKA